MATLSGGNSTKNSRIHFHTHTTSKTYSMNLVCSAVQRKNNYVSEGDWRISTHADPTEWRICGVTLTSMHLYGDVYMRVGVACTLANSSDFWAYEKAKFTKIW